MCATLSWGRRRRKGKKKDGGKVMEKGQAMRKERKDRGGEGKRV